MGPPVPCRPQKSMACGPPNTDFHEYIKTKVGLPPLRIDRIMNLFLRDLAVMDFGGSGRPLE